MNERERKLRAERDKLVNDQRAMIATADEEKRDLSAEDNDAYEKMEERIAQLEKNIQREKTLATREHDLTQSADSGDVSPDLEIATRERPRDRAEETRQSVQRWLSGEMEVRTLADSCRLFVEGTELPEDFRRMQSDINRRFLTEGERAITPDEKRALQMDADIYGGYVTMPQQFIQDLIQAVDNEVHIRQLATIYRVPKAESLGAPSLDADPADQAWTKEIGTGTEDSTMAFGKRELHPHPLAKLIKISKKLVRASFLNIEALVSQRLTYKNSVVLENAYINGTGAGQPLGLMVASDDGISTGRDVSTDNLATEITADGLIEAMFTLKPQYLRNARWGFHRDAVKQARKMKDGNGQYIWVTGLTTGAGDQILGLPYFTSEYMPNTFTASQYVGLLGDFSYYWIADALDMEIQVLLELYAETNQNGYISRFEGDGMPVLEEAFVRVKLGA